MKCEHCGGNLSLTAEKCPYCGQINEQAKKHINDMKRYQGAFESTKCGVYDRTDKYTGTVVRVVLIAVLLIVIVITMIIGSSTYEIRSAWMRRKALKNAAEYMEIMDGYLAEEDFVAFAAFCQENYLDTYDNVYEKYAQVERAAQQYTYVYSSIMEIVSPPEYRELEDFVEYLAENLDYFYETLEGENYEYYEGVDTEQNRRALAAMQEKVELMLQHYLGLSKEDAEGFQSLSKAKRAVVLEEAVYDKE